MPTRSTLLVSAAAALLLVAPAHALAAPAHDDFADAAEATSLPFAMTVDTAGATDEEFEGSLETGGDRWCTKNPGIWVRFTPENTTTVVAVIDGPQEAAAALFEGTDETSLSFIYCMRSLDGRPGSSDGNLHTLEGGHTYHVRLSTAEDGPAEGSYDFMLGVASGITGLIRNQDGNPLDDTLVWAYDGARRRIAAACSHDGGRYRVSGLPAGTYRLRYEARACGGTGGGEGAIEWYDDAESFDSAAPVVVKASDDTTGINVELGRKPEASPTPSESRTPDETASPRPSKTDDPEETPNTTPSASDSPAAIGARAPGEDGGSPWVVGLFVLALLVPASAGGVYLARRKGGRTAT